MNYTIISIIILIIAFLLVSISYVIFKKKEIKLNQYIDLLTADKNDIEMRNIIDLNAIISENNDLQNDLFKLNDLLETKELKSYESKDLNQIIKIMIEKSSNIDVVANVEPKHNIEEKDIKKELEMLVNDVYQNIANKKLKIDLIVDKQIDNKLIYDNSKLISALRKIILKSIENGIKDKITVNVKNIQKSKSNLEIRIIIDNVRYSMDSDEEDKIEKFMCLKTIDPEIYSCSVDSDFLVIRQNLLHIAKRVCYGEENTNTIHKRSIMIDLIAKKVKSKRKRYKALVVDDNKQIAKMNQDVLKELNIDSTIVFSGKDCLDELKDNYEDYDIIITDNQMPNMNGTDLIYELKNIPNFDLPVVIVTADDNYNNSFINHYGFDGYIQKPLEKSKVEKVIKKLIK